MPATSDAKQKRLVEIEEKLNHTTDRLGMPIDKGIFETVLYLNALNLPTTQSCEGHLDGHLSPWVSFAPPGEPEYRYEGEAEVYQQIAASHGISTEEVRTGYPEEKYLTEANSILSNHAELPEYLEWQQECDKLSQKLEILLADYHSSRHPKPTSTLSLQGVGGTAGFLIFQDGIDQQTIQAAANYLNQQKPDSDAIPDLDTSPELRSASDILAARQSEMAAFTQFLKEYYDSGQFKIESEVAPDASS